MINYRVIIITYVAMASLALGGCVQAIKEDRTKVALMNAGIADPTATCMSHRMSQKLSIAQLEHLQALGGKKRSWQDYLDAVGRVHDPDALSVLASSYGLCEAGFIH